MWHFVIFGKDGCSLCDNRKTVISSALKRAKIEGEITVYDVDTTDGMVEMSMLDNSKGEIPIVCAYKDDVLQKMWDGPRAVVRTKEVIELLNS